MRQRNGTKYGQLKVTEIKPEIVAGFWARVIKGETPDDCWHWKGRDGKPAAKTRGTTLCIGYSRCLVTRLAFELVNGKIAGKLDLHHTCSDEGCINPAHQGIGRRTVYKKANRQRGQVLRLVFLPQNIRLCDKVPLRKRCSSCLAYYTGYAGDHSPHNCEEARKAALLAAPSEIARENAA